MARFGKLPVTIPEGVKVKFADNVASVSGPKGELTKQIPDDIKIEIGGNQLEIKKVRGGKKVDMLQGTYRAHLANMIYGVTEGWGRNLEIVGAGYRAAVEGKKLILSIGYSHPVIIEIPEGMEVSVEKSIIKLLGSDKEMVGHIAALIRSKREPEPYKGAGIKYEGEQIRRKAGKQAAKSEGA